MKRTTASRCDPTDEAEVMTRRPFGIEQAQVAARLYGLVGRPRGRKVDLAIAAHAISRDALVWTLNVGDFEDIPGLATVPLG